MSGWMECKLGDIVTFQRGFDITKKEQFPGSYPVVSSSGINSYHNAYKVKCPGVVIGRKGTLGTVFYLNKDFWPHDTTLWVKIFHGNYPLFIFYFLKGYNFQQYDVGSSNPTLNRNHIHLLPSLIPPLPEQRAIASVLSCLDDKIDLLHRQNKTIEAMAETLFRQWFVEEAQEGWEEKPLSSIADFLNGLACQKYPPENEVDKLPVLKIKELRNGFTKDSDWATIDVKPGYIVENGDVIFSWSASLMVKIWGGEKCILNQHLFKVTSEVYPKWFYYQWCKHYLEEFVSISASHATTMGHIKRGDLDVAMVLVPSNGELQEMSEIMAPIVDKMIGNNNQICTLEKLRDTLLPKLMSGEVRVKLEQQEAGI